jgi:acyl-CoA oxidase
MVHIRAGIVQAAGMVLARSATVAVRYCAVRQQFRGGDSAQVSNQEATPETQGKSLRLALVFYLMLIISLFTKSWTIRPCKHGSSPSWCNLLLHILVSHCHPFVYCVLIRRAHTLAGRQMTELYYENQRAMAKGDFGLLEDTHASSSGLKSLCSLMAAEGIETCRRALGGHGFSQASGLGSLYADCAFF